MPSPAQFTVDTSRWPLVVVTNRGKPSHAQLARHLTEIEERVLARDQPFVQVIDQREGEMLDAVQRSLVAQHQERMDAHYARHCIGEAYVVTRESRAAMTAVFWMAHPPYPYTFVETMAEALGWARAQLSGRGLPSG